MADAIGMSPRTWNVTRLCAIRWSPGSRTCAPNSPTSATTRWRSGRTISSCGGHGSGCFTRKFCSNLFHKTAKTPRADEKIRKQCRAIPACFTLFLWSSLLPLAFLASWRLIPSPHQFFQRLDDTWHGGLGIFLRFIFQGDVAAEIRLAQDLGQPLQIGVLLFHPCALDLGLDLTDHGVRRQFFQIRIGVGGVEVTRVEVDAEPVMLDGLHQHQHLIECRRDAAVFLQGQIDAVLASMVARLLDGLDTAGAGLFLRVAAGRVAGKDADGLAAQPRGV